MNNRIRTASSIPVVGKLKHGKSSFFNIMFGKILPVDHEKCTFGKIMIVNKKKNRIYINGNLVFDRDNCEKIDLRFKVKFYMNQYRLKKEELNIIIETEIEETENKSIAFYDTQGLGDEKIKVNDYKNLISSSCCCIYVLDYGNTMIGKDNSIKLEEEEIEIFDYIEKINKYNKNIIFIISKYDELNKEENDDFEPDIDKHLEIIINKLNNKYNKYSNRSGEIKFTIYNTFGLTEKTKYMLENKCFNTFKTKIGKKLDLLTEDYTYKNIIHVQMEFVHKLLNIIMNQLKVINNKVIISDELINDYKKFYSEEFINNNKSIYVVYNLLTFGGNILSNFYKNTIFSLYNDKLENSNKFLQNIDDDEYILINVLNHLNLNGLTFNCNTVDYDKFQKYADFKKIDNLNLKYTLNCDEKKYNIGVTANLENGIPSCPIKITINDFPFCDYISNDDIVFYRITDSVHRQIFKGKRIYDEDLIINEDNKIIYKGVFTFYIDNEKHVCKFDKIDIKL